MCTLRTTNQNKDKDALDRSLNAARQFQPSRRGSGQLAGSKVKNDPLHVKLSATDDVSTARSQVSSFSDSSPGAVTSSTLGSTTDHMESDRSPSVEALDELVHHVEVLKSRMTTSANSASDSTRQQEQLELSRTIRSLEEQISDMRVKRQRNKVIFQPSAHRTHKSAVQANKPGISSPQGHSDESAANKVRGARNRDIRDNYNMPATQPDSGGNAERIPLNVQHSNQQQSDAAAIHERLSVPSPHAFQSYSPPIQQVPAVPSYVHAPYAGYNGITMQVPAPAPVAAQAQAPLTYVPSSHPINLSPYTHAPHMNWPPSATWPYLTQPLQPPYAVTTDPVAMNVPSPYIAQAPLAGPAPAPTFPPGAHSFGAYADSNTAQLWGRFQQQLNQSQALLEQHERENVRLQQELELASSSQQREK